MARLQTYLAAVLLVQAISFLQAGFLQQKEKSTKDPGDLADAELEKIQLAEELDSDKIVATSSDDGASNDDEFDADTEARRSEMYEGYESEGVDSFIQEEAELSSDNKQDQGDLADAEVAKMEFAEEVVSAKQAATTDAQLEGAWDSRERGLLSDAVTDASNEDDSHPDRSNGEESTADGTEDDNSADETQQLPSNVADGDDASGSVPASAEDDLTENAVEVPDEGEALDEKPVPATSDNDHIDDVGEVIDKKEAVERPAVEKDAHGHSDAFDNVVSAPLDSSVAVQEKDQSTEPGESSSAIEQSELLDDSASVTKVAAPEADDKLAHALDDFTVPQIAIPPPTQDTQAELAITPSTVSTQSEQLPATPLTKGAQPEKIISADTKPWTGDDARLESLASNPEAPPVVAMSVQTPQKSQKSLMDPENEQLLKSVDALELKQQLLASDGFKKRVNAICKKYSKLKDCKRKTTDDVFCQLLRQVNPDASEKLKQCAVAGKPKKIGLLEEALEDDDDAEKDIGDLAHAELEKIQLAEEHDSDEMAAADSDETESSEDELDTDMGDRNSEMYEGYESDSGDSFIQDDAEESFDDEQDPSDFADSDGEKIQVAENLDSEKIDGTNSDNSDNEDEVDADAGDKSSETYGDDSETADSFIQLQEQSTQAQEEPGDLADAELEKIQIAEDLGSDDRDTDEIDSVEQAAAESQDSEQSDEGFEADFATRADESAAVDDE